MKSPAFFVLMIMLSFFSTGCGVSQSSNNPALIADVNSETTVVSKPADPQLFEPGAFEDPNVCSSCHRDIYNLWSKSMHAYAWEDKWYQPDYLFAHQQTNGATDLLCGACHAPIAARTGLLPPADGSKFDAASHRGVSCDFCHTVSGVNQMFNMGHVSEPSHVKRGPRGDGRSLYQEVKYTEIHTKAEF